MGNDDAGQMSAWYILSAMGFHPVCPGDQKYMLGSPLFRHVEIKLDQDYYMGNNFTIIARDNSPENIYVQRVSLNGKELERLFIFHHEITAGGELVFEMGDSPNKDLYSRRK
jgi:putative alpha-1,2-mannosidase